MKRIVKRIRAVLMTYQTHSLSCVAGKHPMWQDAGHHSRTATCVINVRTTHEGQPKSWQQLHCFRPCGVHRQYVFTWLLKTVYQRVSDDDPGG